MASNRYWVIQAVGFVGQTTIGGPDVSGEYLKEYDPDAHHGQGFVTWTDKREEAKRFPDMQAAAAEYKRTSKVRPKRPDGQPNRPLTAFTVTLTPVQEEV